MFRCLCTVVGFLWALHPSVLSGEVVISELAAAQSDRILHWDEDGVPRLGFGPAWYEEGFDDSAWSRNLTPLGMGRGGLARDLSAQLLNKTPSLFLRTVMTVTASQAAMTQNLEVAIRVADGFVLYLNGRELARRNAGPEHLFVHTDFEAFRAEDFNATLNLGRAADLLQTGDNLLALQVHNNDVADGVLHCSAVLRIATQPAVTLAGTGQTWSWREGLGEPSGGLFDPLVSSTSFADWVELQNRGPVAVNLQGWSMSDDQDNPRQFVFPSLNLPPGGRAVLLADGVPTPAGSTWLHLPFGLARNGEFLGLFDASGFPVDGVYFPKQDSRHSYGRVETDQSWQFLPNPSPGTPNDSNGLEGRVEAIILSLPGGFHAGPITVEASCPTAGAELRYSLDGTEPTLTSGLVYEGPLQFAQTAILRVRGFATGLIPTRVRTATYLLDQPPEIRLLPAVCLVGDPARDFFRPFGVTSISGGQYTASGWQSTGPDDYNLPLVRGRLFERPVSFEWFPVGDAKTQQEDAGLRIAASTAERPTVRFTNLGGQWSATEAHEKPSFNLFFRNDYEGSLNHDLFEGGRTKQFTSLRLRSGKNDISAPFITDEMIRRLTDATGQPNAVGAMTTLFVNGLFRGYYNLTERVTGDSLQEWHESANGWHVIKGQAPSQAPAGTPWVVEEGDDADFRQMLDFFRGADLRQTAQYMTATQWLDVHNFIDYLLPSVWAGVVDWHMNNWVAARETVETGRWQFYVWDAEWGFNLHPSHWILPNADYVQNWLLSTNDFKAGVPITILFTRLRENADFRMLFADRVQRLFFGDGPMTIASVKAWIQKLREPLFPLQEMLLDGALNQPGYTGQMYGWFDAWMEGGQAPDGDPYQGRNAYFFPQLRQHELWPATSAPEPSVGSGVVAAGTSLEIINPNAGGEIYVVLGGGDPRGADGNPTVSVWKGPLLLQENTRLLARVRQEGEWSPVADLNYLVPQVRIQFEELHYHPLDEPSVDGDLMEFLEISNPGEAPADLSGAYFSDGIQFLFPAGVMILPGERLVLVSDSIAFSDRYPGVAWAGQYGGNLSNGGETVTLRGANGVILETVAYDDVAPWPVEADGGGYSLIAPQSGPRDGTVAWSRSAFRHGSPGEAEPEDLQLYLGEGTWRGVGGLIQSDWFGQVLGSAFPWIWQEQHGWMYAAGPGGDSLWLYDFAARDWVWTSPVIYPFGYFAGAGGWRSYLAPTSNPRWFWDVREETWITIP